MQVFREWEQDDATRVGWGVRAMVVSSATDGVAARRVAGLGGIVETVDEVFLGLSALIDDPVGYGLLVIECDDFGGIDAGRQAFAMLGELSKRIPVILITRDCPEQTFPADRRGPIILRAPVSAVALRVGFEYALRGRQSWRAA